MEDKVKIILADSQYITSVGLRYLLSQTPKLEVVDVVSSQKELITSIEKHEPDLIMLDYNQPDSFALADIPGIISQYPNCNVLIISSDESQSNIRRSVQLGIKGFLTKKCREDELRNAIQTILNGGKFFCDRVLNILIEEPKEPDARSKAFGQLTDREKEIVKLVAEGLTTKKIAEKLFLSPHTISTHRKNALKKLQIGSVPELVKFVVEGELE